MDTSVEHGSAQQLPPSLAWLVSSELPDKDKIVLLVEEYYSNVHHLRCFGFIAKLRYMENLENSTPDIQRRNPLLHIICALGAKFYVLKVREVMSLPDDFSLKAGNKWAEKAKLMLFSKINNISVQETMAVVLLHEHDLRIGNYNSAFMLTGLAVRMAQALQINIEKTANVLSRGDEGQLSWSCREARRRLMWSIYIMDTWVGSGVDELTLVDERDIKIQLPCTEHNFTLQIPCIVETIRPGEYLPFISAQDREKEPIDSLDIPAQFIRLLSLRRKVLRYVKHLDTVVLPWLPESEFNKLETTLLQWYEDLPDSLYTTRPNIYMRKDSSQLGALLLLHWIYHQTLCDLNRIGMRELFNIPNSFILPPDQEAFVTRIQDRCVEHAECIAMIFGEALKHGNEALADTWLPVIAHDSCRVIVHYTSHQLGTAKLKRAFIRGHHVACLQRNLKALKKMIPMYQLSQPLYLAAAAMVKRGGFEFPELTDIEMPPGRLMTQENDAPATLQAPPPQLTPEHVLNPLAIYSMARIDIQEENYPTSTAVVSGASQAATMSPPVGPQHRAATPIPPPGPAPYVEPGNNNSPPIPTGSWFQNGTGNSISGGTFQLLSSSDNLQTYFPLMFNNFSLPFGSTSFAEDVAGPIDVSVSDFGEASAAAYPTTVNAVTDDVPMTGTGAQTSYSSVGQSSSWQV